jgi:thioredoxin-dependent adenylylsulfate APS reductase
VKDLEKTGAGDLIAWAIETFGNRFAVVTSLQAEGMVVTDLACRISTSVRVLTLDTGRLPEETYEMIEKVRSRYGIAVETIAPASEEVEAMVALHGPNLFYRDVALRMLCCEVRKVRPLERRLHELKAWAGGLRRSQSETRAGLTKAEEQNGILKLSPLADWTRDQVWDYIRQHDVPVHPLYARGYTSIGCGPCTRATKDGEDERAGRWWWEQDTAKECGLHFTADGRARRAVDVLLDEILGATARA